MKHKIAVSALLVIALLMSIFTSCGESAEIAATTNDAPVNRAGVEDSIPAGLKFDGQTVTILVRDEEIYAREAMVEKLNGDVLNDAIYNRDRTVAERFNIKTNYVYKADPELVADESVLSGIDEYQIVGATSHHLIESGIAGNLYNLRNEERFPYLDFTKPWWSGYYVENASIYDQLYTIVGDYSLSYMMYTYAIFYNKTLADEYGIPDMYALVKEGKWTIDKLMELASSVYTDVTGDGKTEDDIFGFAFDTCNMIDPFWSAFDISIITLNSENTPEINLDIEKHKAVLEKLYALLYDLKYSYSHKAVTYEDNCYGISLMAKKLANDELLFAELMFEQCDREWMRNMKSDYGIIPMPKWDEAQEEYYSFTDEWHTIWGVPITVTNPALVSAVLECMAAESYRYVTPAYYNDILNGRYMRDLESTEMLDYIVSHNKTSFGMIYSVPLKRIAHNLLRNILGDDKSTNISSYWRGNKKMYTTALTKMLTSVEKNIKNGK